MKKQVAEEYQGQEFVITREFDAPRALVFRAWTDPRHLAQWWGPRGFTNPVCDWDPRPGKAIHVVMRAPNGVDYPMGGEFREIIAPELLVFAAGALDEQGKMLFEFLHTALFVERKGKTLLTLRSRVEKTTAGAGRYIGGFEAGMTQSLERLAELLAQSTAPLVMERTFAAPVGLVWEALTNRDKIVGWFFDIKEFKPEVGFKFEMHAEKDGVKYLHLCQVAEVIPLKKLAYSWRYDQFPGDSLVTIELFAIENETRLRLTHAGLETFPQTDNFNRKNFNQGWSQIIGVFLKAFVENTTADREIRIFQTVTAPRELVWAAMTDPKQVIHWWGPRGFSTTVEVMDVRPGGEWKHVMQGPDGTKYPNHSVFTEVVKPERIVYTHGGHRENGPSVSFISTWTFDEVCGGNTKVTIRMVFPTPDERDRVAQQFGAIEGGKQTLARLEEHLASQPVVLERVLEAPVEKVWRAITEVTEMKQWYFPQLESFRAEVGFETQFNVAEGAKNYPHIWKVTEVLPGRKISYCWQYGGYPGESLLTMELFAEEGKSRLKLIHSGLETFQPGQHPELARENFVKGWLPFMDSALPGFLKK